MDTIITSFRVLYSKLARTVATKCIVLFLLIFGLQAKAQGTFISNATAGWNAASSWTLQSGTDADGIPDSNDVVTIKPGNTITLSGAEACSSLTIGDASTNSTAKLDVAAQTLTVGGNVSILASNGARVGNLTISTGTVNIGGNLTSSAAANAQLAFSGAGTINMTGATSAWSFSTSGTFTKSTSTINFSGTTPSITVPESFNNVTIKTGSTTTATALFAATGTFTIEAGGKYIHNAAGSGAGATTDFPGATRSFAATSTVEIQKWSDGVNTSPASLPGSVTWGNLIINIATLGGSINMTGTLTTVNGNLTIAATGGGTREFRLSGNTAYTLAIGGDLIITGGILNLTNGTGTLASPMDVTIGGNFNQSGGTFTQNATNHISIISFTGGASNATFATSAGTFTSTRMNWVIASGKTLANNTNFGAGNWIATGRTMTVNGSFQVNQGSFTGSGAGGTWTYGSGATLIYNFTQTTAYGPVDATHGYWPASNGPVNVILQMQNTNAIDAGAVQLGAARTITGTLSTNNANGRTMFLDLNGNTFQCANITVGTTAPLTLSGTTTTTATGNVSYSSNFTINGDLKVGGNWTKASSGLTFTRNGKAVFFTGSGTTQTITVTGGGTETFDYVLIDKATAGSLTLATGTNMTIAATTGNTFEIKTSASSLNLNGQTINFSSTGGNIHANGVASTINGAAGSKIAVSNGTKTFTTASGSWSIGANVSLETNSGVNFGSNLVTLNGTFKILSGGFASGNTAPIYASGSTLEIGNGGSFSLYDNTGANESAAWFRNVTATGSAQQGVPWNFVVSNSSSVNWNSTGGDAFHRDINGNFTISSGSFAMSTTASGDLLVKGNFTNNGTFTANGRTVTLNGTSQSISGSTTTFQDLVFATNTSTKTLGVATTISGNLNINSGVKADLGTFASTSATLTTGGSSRTTGTSYGGTGSPAANIDTTYFVANSGYLNVGGCASYALTGTANTSTCISTAATVSVSATAGNLPVGTYTVFYTLTGANTGSTSTTMTVSTAGSGSFTTSTLSNSGSTTITINHLTNGCVSRLTTNNTATITVNPNNTAGSPSSTPTLCINTALTAITHTTTGATGIGSPTGLPTGVTAGWASNTITISGTPTASGTFNYSIPLTGGCGSVNATGTITVTPNNTAGSPSSTPTLCINTALTAITHSTTGATGIGTPTGLPSGVTAGWASNTITISGTPTASGTFNYSIPLTGGCGSVNATGTITVTPANTAGSPSSTPTLCINTALTAITHTTTGATGIGSPTGLPSGVTAGWASNTITISGTPTASGTFNYSIPLTGGCGSVNATGTITVTPNNTAGSPSSTPTLCINTALTAITHTTTGATGIGTPTGLPSGVTAGWASNTITISGTPTASGTFNYSIPLTGGCGSVNATGTITVNPDNTVGAASSTPTLCINTALTAITHSTTGATGIGSPTGLPSGVTAGWASNTITISGTPTASGVFNYSIPLTGGCGSVNATGTITVTPANTAGSPSSTPTLCINTALTAITHTTTGATGIGSPTGLPSGVTAGWASNTITISGTPTASGTFNYSIPLMGGCGSVNATGTITVNPNNTAGSPSSTPTLCINTALTAITHSTTGATGIGSPTGLPTGVTAGWASNTITISGTPTASGTFNYSIPLTGGCGSVNATGTITVNPDNTVGAASSTPTLCINTALTAITHTTTGATGIGSPTGLPSGVTAGWASNTITISGTPTASGVFNYSIPLTGGCGSFNATGTITVNPASTAAVISGTASICAGTTTNIQVAITGGVSPYTVVYSAGSVGSYVSGTDIPVTPTSSTTYTLTSVTSANGCVGSGNSGSAVVSIDSTTSTNGGPWSNGSPAAGKSVIFDNTSISLGSDFAACSLTLKNSSVVTIQSGTDVTLTGAIAVETGSTFTLNNNANLLQTIPAGTSYSNSGNIVVKRDSSALKRLDYTLWSSPVTGQGVYSFSPYTFGNRFYVYRTNTNVYNNADVGFSITGLDPNGVNGTDSNNVQFATAKGYLIRMPWDHPTAATIWNGQFTGVPHNGDITYTMTNGGAGQRFNLVGNPYPSPIDMTQFVSDNSAKITGTLYFWRETNNNTSNNAYCSWAGGTFTTNGEAQVFNPNGIIRTGQGFFVEASGAATTVDFKNGQRSGDNANQFFRTNNSNAVNDVTETNRFWLNLTNASGAFSQMAAGYMTNATNSVDIYDGRNINTGNVLLNSILNNEDYTIQGRALPFATTDVIPLSYKVTDAGNYTIAIDHTDGLFAGNTQPIYLKDNLTATEHDLQTGAYTFASVAGSFTNRFEIIFQSQLGIDTPVFTADTVVIYNQNNTFVINAGNTIMASVKVFDIRGRLLQEKININASQTVINNGLSNEVLLVQITSEDSVTITKKVIR